MKLRAGLEQRYVGSKHYVGREHAGGAVITGPMPLTLANAMAQEIIRDGHRAAIAADEDTRAAWFRILVDLGRD